MLAGERIGGGVVTRQAQLKADLAAERRQKDLYRTALGAVMDAPDSQQAVECVREYKGDGRTYIRAYRLTAAHGGIVVTTYKLKGQRDSTDAAYFDDWHANVRARIGDPYFQGFALAAERIAAVRERLNRPERLQIDSLSI